MCLEFCLGSFKLLAFSLKLTDGRAFCRGWSVGSQVSCNEFDKRSEVGVRLSGFV